MYIYGASGHGRVIIDMIDSYEQIHGVFDDDPQKTELLGYPVLGSLPATFVFTSDLFIAIGDNHSRKTINDRLVHRVKFANIIHESAIFSKRADLGVGCVVMEGAIVKVGCELKNQVIVNTGASIDHDCLIEDYVHIAPQATLCGGIHIGEGTLIGANAIILPGVKVGSWCSIGAGSIVHQDVPDHSTWIGNRLQSTKVRVG
ncbi:MAG: acetyltransferase [Lunatimonas sp.]|uniref:acetyltransferase n=1 Tax=Lunatimonas sp. TaxID=2060141 RepID=UPI00263B55DF|nr:acetyltransferase [Lunatimonas sp.]MCC5936777.1 acetyltransferase [Lunatimonas sp.]